MRTAKTLNLRWAHMPFCLFCHETALRVYSIEKKCSYDCWTSVHESFRATVPLSWFVLVAL